MFFLRYCFLVWQPSTLACISALLGSLAQGNNSFQLEHSVLSMISGFGVKNKSKSNKRSGLKNAFDPVPYRLSVVTAEFAFHGLRSTNVIIPWHCVEHSRSRQLRTDYVGGFSGHSGLYCRSYL